ncbi:GNAT family N-acetyltransferase [Nonomuraea spiralis]|uniref:GNAT family N-acetyltransferase n=1 Tax=Nonomuraea spiralis TaxID=46182 RepID=UPI0037AF2BFB
MMMLTVGPPPLPPLGPPWTIRRVSPEDGDARLVWRWMNEPHVATAWDQAWTLDKWTAELTAQLSGDHSLPCVAAHEGRDVAYLEIYRVRRDRLAALYASEPSDLGVHIAVGEAGDTGRGLGSLLLRAVADGLLAADPACARVVAEPNVLNLASVRAFGKAGFRRAGEVAFPHKTAALMVRPRPGHGLTGAQG